MCEKNGQYIDLSFFCAVWPMPFDSATNRHSPIVSIVLGAVVRSLSQSLTSYSASTSHKISCMSLSPRPLMCSARIVDMKSGCALEVPNFGGPLPMLNRQTRLIE